MASGSAGYYIYKYNSSILKAVGKWWMDAAVIMGCALSLYFQHWSIYILFTMAAAYFIVRASRMENKMDLISLMLSFGPLNYLGKISYGIYLFHLPLLFGISSIMPQANHLLIVFITTIAAICLASFSFHLFENPIRKMVKKWM